MTEAREVAELRAMLHDAQVRLDEQRKMTDAAEAAADRRMDRSIEWMERAEAAEAREAALRARIEALADSPSQPGRWVFPEGDEDAPGVWVTDLRAALTSPAEDTTPTEQQAQGGA